MMTWVVGGGYFVVVEPSFYAEGLMNTLGCIIAYAWKQNHVTTDTTTDDKTFPWVGNAKFRCTKAGCIESTRGLAPAENTVLVHRLTPGLDVVMVHGGHRLVDSRLLSVDAIEWVSRRRGECTETRFKSWRVFECLAGGSRAQALVQAQSEALSAKTTCPRSPKGSSLQAL